MTTYALIIVVWNMWGVPERTLLAHYPDLPACEQALSQSRNSYRAHARERVPQWFCSFEK
jgi:hypothetical protein